MRQWIVVGLFGLLLGLLWGGIGAGIQPAAGSLEPTPTEPEPTWTAGPPGSKTPQATATAAARPPVRGAIVALHLLFPVDWPWDSAHWQDLWTVVQWQDNQGAWHDVTGWYANLDRVMVDEFGTVVGEKNWWVAAGDLGTGPFRWLVYDKQEGDLLASSEPFDLPAQPGQRVLIEVLLEP
jgi:hypothetical protein